MRVIESDRNVSHYSWKSDDELLITLIHCKNLASYRLYDCNKNIYTEIDEEILNKDGHPSYSPNGDLLLTDTYPDKIGYQSLLLYSAKSKLIELGRFRHPMLPVLRYSEEVRCDLHPRWDRSGKRVCFDSTHEGSRAMYIYNL